MDRGGSSPPTRTIHGAAIGTPHPKHPRGLAPGHALNPLPFPLAQVHCRSIVAPQLDALLAPVWSAQTGEQAMERLIDAGAIFEPRILALNRAMLRAGDRHGTVYQLYQGRMTSRFQVMRDVVSRIHNEGRLPPDWDIDTAAGFVWALTAPPAFDMLVAQHGWSADHWAASTKLLLRNALLTR